MTLLQPKEETMATGSRSDATIGYSVIGTYLAVETYPTLPHVRVSVASSLWG